MFLGWYDPDKKTPARYKLEDALERYARKFGRPALTCITSPEDAAELEADKEAPPMPVRGVGFIPRYTFYVGIDEEAEEVVRSVAGNLPGTGERKSVRRKKPTGDSDHPEMTAVAKTRRRPGSNAPKVPEPNPRAKPTLTEPVMKPRAMRPKADAGVKPEILRAQSDQRVKPGATRAKTDVPVKSGAKRPATAPGVNPEVAGTKTDQGAKRGGKSAGQYKG